MLTLISIALLEKVVAWKSKQNKAARMTLPSVLMIRWKIESLLFVNMRETKC